MEYSNEDLVLTFIKGTVTIRVVNHPERSFAFHVTLDLVKGEQFFTKKPLVHFHANQDEYIQALEGNLGLEVEGKEIVLTSRDPEFRIGAWVNHRSYPLEPPRQDGSKVVVFLLSGEPTRSVFQLGTLFFENWYGYQDEMVGAGRPIRFLQVLSTFDAGGTYVSLPRWVPLGRRVAQMIGIVGGRWIGSMLGYQPFYRAYSTNWGLACETMESTIFQRRFAKRLEPV
ncbi:hypothetical protein F4820DRAFT_458305 [Hypoxylon rubiginosum]|uniref:Uncharacterized protein n=1 Tax=Hypoxylon rubiginosum TaxID=110542 RepID=A0ACB9Z0P3_9PEZI|nr:hypothetical protein F4820DRAFT_458305 [Hypoxylon rubiginosum]